MKKDLTIFMLAWALVISVQALAQKQTPVEDPFPPPSSILPPVGKIVRYRFTDTLTTSSRSGWRPPSGNRPFLTSSPPSSIARFANRPIM